MGKPYDKVKQMLADVGATLKREGKHHVYELPNGKNFVVSATPSDTRGELNALSDLRHALGVVKTKPTSEPRKPRKVKPGRAPSESWGLPAESSPFASALRQSGLVEQQLRTRIGQLEAENAALQQHVNTIEALWVVRVHHWIVRRVRAARLFINHQLGGSENSTDSAAK
jgi:hypothetical protein